MKPTAGRAKDSSRRFDTNEAGLRPTVLKASLHPSTRPVALPIRIVIANGHALMRDGLRALLSAETDFAVLGEAHDTARAIALVEELSPDLLLLDASLTPHSAFDVLCQLQAMGTNAQTILLTDPNDGFSVVTALQLGARGIVFRQTPTNLLFRSIRRVRTGEIWITREAVSEVVAALVSGTHAPAKVGPRRDFGLTAREQDVLRLIVDGETNKGIATRLDVGADTVKHHLTSIFDKTGASNRLELALFALHHNLVGPHTS